MPQSITIAAFVFGAVLLLISLLGGGFKIFGAEVSGSAGKVGRLVAGVAGFILISVGLIASIYKPITQTTPDEQPTAPVNTQPSPGSSGPTEHDVNIAGIWHDDSGGLTEFTQHGSSVTFGFSGNGTSTGSGTVRGHVLEINYENHYLNGTRSSGRCSGIVSPDGRLIRYSCLDTVYGQSQMSLTR